MIVEENFSLSAPREDVVAFFLDVSRMSACVPGLDSLRQIDGSTYEADLSLRVGPIHARFTGTVDIDDSQAPGRIIAAARGRDARTGSVAQIEFDAEIDESGVGTTDVRSTSDVTIRGRLGQFGTGVIAGTAQEMIKAFVLCAEGALARDPITASPPTPGLARVTGRGLIAYLQRAWSELLDLFRRGKRERGS